MNARTIRTIIAAAALAAVLQETLAAKPILGIVGLGQNSPRAQGFGELVEKNLARLAGASNVFALVEPDKLTAELRRYRCLDEQCILRFAADAGISAVITGRVEDRGEHLLLVLSAYGSDMPYQGRLVYSRRVEIIAEAGSRQFEYIAEEHSAAFLSSFMKNFKSRVSFTLPAEGKPVLDSPLTGIYDVYRAKKEGPLSRPVRIGSVTVRNGIPSGGAPFIAAGDYVLEDHRERASLLFDSMHKKKKDIVFGKGNYTGPISFLFITPPASATMPIVAPIVGYYRNSDWYGLSLWAISAAPYLYLEIDGLTVYFSEYYKKKKDRPREMRTRYHFGMYMLCAGGMGLFTDAFSYGAHLSASNFGEPQPFLGNDATAIFLSVVTGGGGHFYRGKRLWGHLYYHTDNILLYFMIREFSVPQRYNFITRKFEGEKINKKRAYPLLGAFCAVKTAEIIHAIFLKDEIRNGRVTAEEFGFEPFIMPEDSDIPKIGMQVHFNF